MSVDNDKTEEVSSSDRVKSWDFMYKNEVVGTYYEDENRKLKIVINKNIDMNEFRMLFFKLWSRDGVLDDEAVRRWLDSRITPPYQDGIERKLKNWGLKKYDQIDILHKTNGINLKDGFWIKFNELAIGGSSLRWKAHKRRL